VLLPASCVVSTFFPTAYYLVASQDGERVLIHVPIELGRKLSDHDPTLFQDDVVMVSSTCTTISTSVGHVEKLLGRMTDAGRCCAQDLDEICSQSPDNYVIEVEFHTNLSGDVLSRGACRIVDLGGWSEGTSSLHGRLVHSMNSGVLNSSHSGMAVYVRSPEHLETEDGERLWEMIKEESRAGMMSLYVMNKIDNQSAHEAVAEKVQSMAGDAKTLFVSAKQVLAFKCMTMFHARCGKVLPPFESDMYSELFLEVQAVMSVLQPSVVPGQKNWRKLYQKAEKTTWEFACIETNYPSSGEDDDDESDDDADCDSGHETWSDNCKLQPFMEEQLLTLHRRGSLKHLRFFARSYLHWLTQRKSAESLEMDELDKRIAQVEHVLHNKLENAKSMATALTSDIIQYVDDFMHKACEQLVYKLEKAVEVIIRITTSSSMFYLSQEYQDALDEMQRLCGREVRMAFQSLTFSTLAGERMIVCLNWGKGEALKLVPECRQGLIRMLQKSALDHINAMSDHCGLDFALLDTQEFTDLMAEKADISELLHLAGWQFFNMITGSQIQEAESFTDKAKVEIFKWKENVLHHLPPVAERLATRVQADALAVVGERCVEIRMCFEGARQDREEKHQVLQKIEALEHQLRAFLVKTGCAAEFVLGRGLSLEEEKLFADDSACMLWQMELQQVISSGGLSSSLVQRLLQLGCPHF